MPKKLDIDNIVRSYQKDPRIGKETLDEVKRQMLHSDGVRLFIADIAMKGHLAGKQPVDQLGAMLMFGIVLGVIAEQERTKVIV